MGRRAHPSEAVVRQIEKRLESWPEISYAQIAGESGVSRDTVKRIANRQYRPTRARQVARCPGCGGGLKKKGAPCHVCQARAARQARRAAAAAGRLQPLLTGSI